MPGSRLQIEVTIKSADEARKRIIDGTFWAGVDLLPIAIFFIDVGAGFLAGGAFDTLRVRRLPQTMRLGVDLLDEGERTEIIAPGLAGIQNSE